MPIVYLRRISKELIRGFPQAKFVFGDNLIRRGLGGQAAQCRGESNAIGVVTKRLPTMNPDAFFSGEHDEYIAVRADLAEVQAALDAGLTVYVPAEGLGTGRAELISRAPGLYAEIRKFFAERSVTPCPWPEH